MVEGHASPVSALTHPILEDLKQKFGNAIEGAFVQRKDRVWFNVPAEKIIEVAQYLKGLGFDHAVSVSGVDYLEEKTIAVHYFLSSYTKDDLKDLVISMRVKLPRDSPKMPTLTTIWPSAEWHEREQYEMFGIIFEGHPKLEKLILQDNWDGPPPFRKDFKLMG